MYEAYNTKYFYQKISFSEVIFFLFFVIFVQTYLQHFLLFVQILSHSFYIFCSFEIIVQFPTLMTIHSRKLSYLRRSLSYLEVFDYSLYQIITTETRTNTCFNCSRDFFHKFFKDYLEHLQIYNAFMSKCITCKACI